MEIIPAIDIIDGKCVRLTKGDYQSMKIYNEDPLEVAKAFEDHGIGRLHLVDLDGAKARHVVNLKVLERIAGATSLTIDFGGGVQSDEDLENVLNAGASQVTGGSIAVKQPDLFGSWLKKFGPEKIMLGADIMDMKIAVGGWQEQSELHILDFLRNYVERGVTYVISTDISKDGMLQGPAFTLYDEILEAFPELNLIASGGISKMEDIEKLAGTNIFGVIVGKAIYEGRITLKSLNQFINRTPC